VSQNFDAVIWTGHRFLATGEGVAMTSPDGVSWRPVTTSARHSLRGLALAGHLVAAVGDLDTHILIPR
jgi:hypothetical protein